MIALRSGNVGICRDVVGILSGLQEMSGSGREMSGSGLYLSVSGREISGSSRDALGCTGMHHVARPLKSSFSSRRRSVKS